MTSGQKTIMHLLDASARVRAVMEAQRAGGPSDRVPQPSASSRAPAAAGAQTLTAEQAGQLSHDQQGRGDDRAGIAFLDPDGRSAPADRWRTVPNFSAPYALQPAHRYPSSGRPSAQPPAPPIATPYHDPERTFAASPDIDIASALADSERFASLISALPEAMTAGYGAGPTIGEVEQVTYEGNSDPTSADPNPDEFASDSEVAESTLLSADKRDLLIFAREMGTGEHHLLNGLLTHMRKMGASDLTLVVGQPPFFRIDGDLRRLRHDPLTETQMSTVLHRLLTETDVARMQALSKHEMQDGKAADSEAVAAHNVMFAHNGLRYRCNVAVADMGSTVAVRAIDERIKEVRELDLPPAVEVAYTAPSGLIMIVGPTGSGKTTTLSALIKEHATRNYSKIILLEDPIEYLYPQGLPSLVLQRQVGRDVISCGVGVREAMRQDPDVVVVAETVDEEPLDALLRAAQTGHLAFTTLHAGSAVEGAKRAIGMVPASKREAVAAQLAGVLKLIVFQQRVSHVHDGSVVLFEVIPITDAVRVNIEQQDWPNLATSARDAAVQCGGRTLRDSVNKAVQRGEVTLDLGGSLLTLEDRQWLYQQHRL